MKLDSKRLKGMQANYLNMNYPKDQPVDNINEAYFEREELIAFLQTLKTKNVKVALALVHKDIATEKLKHNQLTMIMLGVDDDGRWTSEKEGLISDIPCPPNCRHESAKTKKVFTE